MAEDVNILVLKVKSEGITEGTTQLNALTAAATAAEGASKMLGTQMAESEAITKKSSGTVKAMAEAEDGSVKAIGAATSALQRKAVEQNREIEMLNTMVSAMDKAQAANRTYDTAQAKAADTTAAQAQAMGKMQAKAEELNGAIGSVSGALARKAVEQKRDIELHNMSATATSKLTLEQRKQVFEYFEAGRAYKEAAVEAGKINAQIDKNTLANASSTKTTHTAAEAIRQKTIEQNREVQTLTTLANAQAAAIKEDRARTTAIDAQTRAMASLQIQANAVNATVDKATPANRAHAIAVAQGTEELKKNTNGHGSNAASIRETMVLMHELSQGSYKRFGGSVMVLANQMNWVPKIVESIGVAGLAMSVIIGGAFVGITMGVITGAIELNKFNRSMIATGNMAGLTRDSLHDMANSLADDVTGGSHHASTMLQELAATGKFTGTTLEAVGAAALAFSHITGESSEKVVKMFDGMEHGVAKWALKSNESYHFLTYAQYEHIKVLELQGEKQEAMKVAADAFAASMDDHGRKVGAIVQWYREWGIAIDKVKTFLAHMGAGDTTIESYQRAGRVVLDLQEQIRVLNGTKVSLQDADTKAGNLVYLNAKFKEANASRIEWQIKMNSESAAAKAKGEKATVQADAIAADAQAEVEQRRNRTRHEKMLDDVATEKNVRTRQNAGLLQMQLADKGLSYTTLVADAKAKDQVANEVTRQSGAIRINDLSNEFDAQMAIRRQYGLSVKTNEEQQGTAIAAVKERWKEHANKGADPTAVDRDTGLIAIKGRHKLITEEYEAFIAHSHEQANKEGEDQRDALKDRNEARQGELANIRSMLSEQIAELNKFEGKTEVAKAKNRQKIVALTSASKVSESVVGKAEQKDEDSVTAKEIAEQQKLLKAINATGMADNNRLDAAILAEENRISAIGQLKSVALDFRAQEEASEVAKAQAQSDDLAMTIRIQQAYGYASEDEITASQVQLKYLQDKIDKHGILSKQYVKAAGLQRGVESTDRTTKNLDDALASAKRFEKGMVTAFGNVGKAVGGMSVAFSQMAKDRDTAQMKFNKASKEDIANGTAQADLDRETSTAKLDGYANMSDASKNFFDAGSTGYKTLEGVSKVFHLAEMANTLGLINLKAIMAVINQGGADPITAWPRMAAMAAVVAGLGFAVGGGFQSSSGGGKSAADVQKAQGTGSVFGDIGTKNEDGSTTYKDKSESISKSLELLKANSNVMLPVNQAMLQSLQAIQASMSGLTNLIARAPGLTNGTNMGIQKGTLGTSSGIGTKLIGAQIGSMIGGALLGPLGVWLGGALGGALSKLWGKTTQNIVDSGLQFSGKVSDLQNGKGINQYASVDTTKSSWFGLSKSTSNSVQTQGVSSEMSQQFGLIFSNLEDTLKIAAGALGKNSADVGSAIENMVLNTSVVSLKGLSGTELQNALNGVISKAMDEISEKAFPAMGAFRQVGEGYTQTVIRVASGIENANLAMEQLGIAAVDYTSVANKQGDVAVEIAKQSIAAKEGMSGVNDMLVGMNGSLTELVDAYKSLDAIRKQMNGVGLNGNGLNVNVVKGAGGVSQLGAALTNYQNKFFTDKEKAVILIGDVTKEFNKLGIALPATKGALRSLIESTGTSNADTSKLTGKLIVLSDAYDNAASAMAAANKTSSDALTTTIDGLKKFSDELKTFRDGLLLGSLSNLTPEEKYSEAKRQYETTVAKAMNGDTKAQAAVTSSASAYLEASRVLNASSSDYSASLKQVMTDIDKLADYTGTQLTDSEKQLEALNKQSEGISTLNTTAEGIKFSLDKFLSIIPRFTPIGSTTDVSKGMVEEIVKLRDDLAEANALNAKQMNDLMGVVYDANGKAATAVSTSVSETAQTSAWASANDTSIER